MRYSKLLPTSSSSSLDRPIRKRKQMENHPPKIIRYEVEEKEGPSDSQQQTNLDLISMLGSENQSKTPKICLLDPKNRGVAEGKKLMGFQEQEGEEEEENCNGVSTELKLCCYDSEDWKKFEKPQDSLGSEKPNEIHLCDHSFNDDDDINRRRMGVRRLFKVYSKDEEEEESSSGVSPELLCCFYYPNWIHFEKTQHS